MSNIVRYVKLSNEAKLDMPPNVPTIVHDN